MLIAKENKSEYYNLDYYHERDYKDLDPYLKYILTNRVMSGRNFIKDKIKILDVGCGIGVYIDFLKNQGYTVYGIDYSSVAVKISKQIQASALSLPFKDNSFDIIISAHLIEHLTPEEVKNFLGEINRVLKDFGKVFLLTPNMWSFRRLFNRKDWFKDPAHINMFNPSKIKRVLSKDHFVNIGFRFRMPLFLLHKGVMNERWVISYSGPFWIVRKYRFLQDILFFLFTTTLLAYFRDVIYVEAKKIK